MRKTIFRIILIAFLFSITAIVVIALVAEVISGSAKEMESLYRWDKAKELHLKAAKVNPFDSRHLENAANIVMKKALFSKEKQLLEEARDLFLKANSINSHHPYNYYSLGKIYLNMAQITNAVDNYHLALQKDPNNFRINYLIGYDLLPLWDKLEQQNRDLVLKAFKKAISINPYYAQSVYEGIMYYIKDFDYIESITPKTFEAYKNLKFFIERNNYWQHRDYVNKQLDILKSPEQSLVTQKRNKEIERMKKSTRPLIGLVSAQDWFGSSTIGSHSFINGNMYWGGTINAVIKLNSRKNKIIIQAKGSKVDGVAPFMIVELDNKVIYEAFVENQRQWQDYIIDLDVDKGIKVLSITFANDGENPQRGEDRNLYIGEARIIEK